MWASPGWHKGHAALEGNGTAELFCCLGRDGVTGDLVKSQLSGPAGAG